MSILWSLVSLKSRIGDKMRTEQEMLDVILRLARDLQVQAVALSGSRTNPLAQQDDFQDYDIVYIVDNLDDLISDLVWLDQFGERIIEQHNILGERHLYLMLFEDGNRIDLTLCPKEHIEEWLNSEATFTVLKDEQALFKPYLPSSKRFWITPPSEDEFEVSCNEFWWVSAYVVKGICRKQLIYAIDHLYGICQQELLKILAWQVASDRETVDIGKNYKFLFNYLPAEKEKEFQALLDFSDQKKLTKSLFATMDFFHKEGQNLSRKVGFYYDKETAEKMIEYAKERL